MHLPTKFHHSMFNHSEVIVLTNKQIYKQTNEQTNRFCWKHTPRTDMLSRWKINLLILQNRLTTVPQHSKSLST